MVYLSSLSFVRRKFRVLNGLATYPGDPFDIDCVVSVFWEPDTRCQIRLKSIRLDGLHRGTLSGA